MSGYNNGDSEDFNFDAFFASQLWQQYPEAAPEATAQHQSQRMGDLQVPQMTDAVAPSVDAWYASQPAGHLQVPQANSAGGYVHPSTVSSHYVHMPRGMGHYMGESQISGFGSYPNPALINTPMEYLPPAPLGMAQTYPAQGLVPASSFNDAYARAQVVQNPLINFRGLDWQAAAQPVSYDDYPFGVEEDLGPLSGFFASAAGHSGQQNTGEDLEWAQSEVTTPRLTSAAVVLGPVQHRVPSVANPSVPQSAGLQRSKGEKRKREEPEESSPTYTDPLALTSPSESPDGTQGQLKKRKVGRKACQACRRSKTACSSEEQCPACVKKGIPCLRDGRDGRSNEAVLGDLEESVRSNGLKFQPLLKALCLLHSGFKHCERGVRAREASAYGVQQWVDRLGALFPDMGLCYDLLVPLPESAGAILDAAREVMAQIGDTSDMDRAQKPVHRPLIAAKSRFEERAANYISGLSKAIDRARRMGDSAERDELVRLHVGRDALATAMSYYQGGADSHGPHHQTDIRQAVATEPAAYRTPASLETLSPPAATEGLSDGDGETVDDLTGLEDELLMALEADEDDADVDVDDIDSLFDAEAVTTEPVAYRTPESLEPVSPSAVTERLGDGENAGDDLTGLADELLMALEADEDDADVDVDDIDSLFDAEAVFDDASIP
ncbi:hypothetical protein BKA67DRAFT_540895 [Truncatella angustata]|uniref:Zn(2)-C6 fungal-type domain-containing protein n=1 Tax=Truncatella angustata TaxID=152316 RepID=A0A9P8RKD1_9PEZI|nr:uncharacterized protein BKA67DRAFT_540895 [Truncatella angustata]KAH6645898.1 hypothetical protein BKA67DRAFT_540895 [Truncatella angustata]KAH8205283.1 hypothetical protein TruAng_000530 [Truncatella angustata]